MQLIKDVSTQRLFKELKLNNEQGTINERLAKELYLLKTIEMKMK